MRRRFGSFIIVVALAVLSSTGAEAQNLVTNPDFDIDVTGWAGIGVWDPLDAFGSPSSGSATWLNTNPSTSGALYLSQCVALTGFFEGYDLQGRVLIPTGQTGTGYGYLTAWFYSDPACNDFIYSYGTQQVTTAGVWQLASLTGWTPNGAASVSIGLASQKVGAGDFQVHHDTVLFGANPTMIFGDDFESGDLLQWSAVGGGVD